MILGLTGGFGCGKSTAARLFAGRGLAHVDSDVLIREQVLPLDSVRRAIGARHAQAVGADGQVDRVALARIVFTDDAERVWLEGLTHPLYFDLLRRALRSAPANDWVVEVPLLFEKSMENWFDFTACVACDRRSQIARLEQRGLDPALAEQRISKQLPLARKIELSDFVLWNDGSAGFLKSQVDRIVDVMKDAKAAQISYTIPDVHSSQVRRRDASA
ncbi:MAG TPA: dephospho-CoA kinase [Opitutaceae bacterium]|jgi:dephospho-CoA kinase